MTTKMNQRDEAEGRNTERERLCADLERFGDTYLPEVGRNTAAIHKSAHRIADMLRADAGNEATIDDLRALDRAMQGRYLTVLTDNIAIREQLAARDAELANLRAGLFQYRMGLPADDLACLDHDLKLHGASLAAAAKPVDGGEK